MAYREVSFCLVHNFDIFQTNNEEMNDLSINKILNDYFGALITVSLNQFSNHTCLYLNQVCRNRPYDQEYTFDPVNDYQCYDSCDDDPDILLPKIIMQQTLDIQYYPKFNWLSLFSGKPKSVSLNRKNRNLCLIVLTLI